jgi:predicted anti-sigma-YlaC factor YlaD
MDTSQTPEQFTPEEQQQMLQEIYENTRKTKNYMKWQLIITVALVVIPLIATVSIIPVVLNQLSSIYSGTGLLQ